MEQRKGKKKQLKKRILLRLAAVLSVSMIISSAVGYFYFEYVVKEQNIEDEQANQQQIVSQLQFLTEDIQNFAQSIVVDESLQAALGKKDFANTFDEVKNANVIIKRLAFYNSLRTYIAGSFLELSDGRRYSSSISANESDYIERKFGEEEIQTYLENPQWIYSNPYKVLETRDSSQVVCFRAPMWSTENFGVRQGTLYVEVYLEDLLQSVENYGVGYENVYLLGNQEELLYLNGDSEKITAYVRQEGRYPESGVYPSGEGYIICKDISETGWQLCTLITREYLWQQSSFVWEFFVLFFLISLSIMLVVTSKILERTIRPVTKLSQQMERTSYPEMEMGEIVYTGDEIQTLYECYQDMIGEIKRGIEEKLIYDKQKKEMEFDIMLSQINPHYLYNVLNTIVYLAAAEKNKNIVKITNSLIYTLQSTLNLGEHSIETRISEELELTRCYAAIQEYRYPEMFSLEISCPEELQGFRIPKTSIQPLVENALLHGILPTEEPGKIRVNICREDMGIQIMVADNGIGISQENLEKFRKKQPIIYGKNNRKHIGISNIRDRIAYLYGEPYSMEILPGEKGGTMVFLHIPELLELERDLDNLIGKGEK